MNYMEKIDAWLTEEIQKLLDNWPGHEGQEGFDAFKRTIKDKILESYRNGQRAGTAKKASASSKSQA